LTLNARSNADQDANSAANAKGTCIVRRVQCCGRTE
jgi:hypothetical protein